MIKQMGEEFILIWMEQDTKESGKWINSMAKAKRYGLTMHNMKETINMERSMAKEFLNGLMELLIMDNLLRIT